MASLSQRDVFEVHAPVLGVAAAPFPSGSGGLDADLPHRASGLTGGVRLGQVTSALRRPWAFMHRASRGHAFQFFLKNYLEVELLGYVIFLTSQETATQSAKVAEHPPFPPVTQKASSFSTRRKAGPICFSVPFRLHVRGSHLVLVYISLTTKDTGTGLGKATVEKGG